MKLSEHNQKILSELVESYSRGNVNVYKELLTNPERAIIHIKSKLHHIRYVAKCIIEDRDI